MSIIPNLLQEIENLFLDKALATYFTELTTRRNERSDYSMLHHWVSNKVSPLQYASSTNEKHDYWQSI